jgi:hypothetical protein
MADMWIFFIHSIAPVQSSFEIQNRLALPAYELEFSIFDNAELPAYSIFHRYLLSCLVSRPAVSILQLRLVEELRSVTNGAAVRLFGSRRQFPASVEMRG